MRPWATLIPWQDPFVRMVVAAEHVRKLSGLSAEGIVDVAVPAVLEYWSRREWAERTDLDPHWVPSAWNQFFWSHGMRVVFVHDMDLKIHSSHFEVLLWAAGAWMRGNKP